MTKSKYFNDVIIHANTDVADESFDDNLIGQVASRINRSELEITIRSSCSETETERFYFTFDKINYHLFLFEKVLFKMPDRIGQWLFSRGFAVENYENPKRIEEEA